MVPKFSMISSLDMPTPVSCTRYSIQYKNGDNSLVLVRVNGYQVPHACAIALGRDNSFAADLPEPLLLQSVGGVREQLAQEHFLVSVDGVGYYVQQPLCLRLELALLLVQDQRLVFDLVQGLSWKVTSMV